MMTRILAKGYLWLLLALLYSPILIIMVFSFTEAKVLGNWTGFSTKLYSSLFTGGMHHSLTSAIWNTFAIAMLAATASTALGSIAAIGIFNLRHWRPARRMVMAGAFFRLHAGPADSGFVPHGDAGKTARGDGLAALLEANGEYPT